MSVNCPKCFKEFKSKRYLKQHLNKKFDCKNTYVDVELLNKIVTSKNDFLQKEELLKVSERI